MMHVRQTKRPYSLVAPLTRLVAPEYYFYSGDDSPEDHCWDEDVDHSKSYESSYTAQQSYNAGTGLTSYSGNSSATSEGLLHSQDRYYGQGNNYPGTC